MMAYKCDSNAAKTLYKLGDFLKSLAIQSQDIGKILKIGQAYGSLYSRNNCGIYRDDLFEERIYNILKQDSCGEEFCKDEKIIHLISTPYRTGGHTRLLERLLEFLPERSDVLITRPYDVSSVALRHPCTAKIYHSTVGFSIYDIKKIVDSYPIVCLHIHPDDLVAASAVGWSKQHDNKRVIFINHADHVFSFGISGADVVAEVSAFGMELSSRYRCCNSYYLGIPIDIEKFDEINFVKKQEYVIFSSGNYLKYKPFKNFSFPNIVNNILQEISNVTIYIIGPQKNDPWWSLAEKKFPERLKIIKNLPYHEYIQLVKSADLYIDSLPMSGGTALPEMRSLGVPVTGVLTGALGYTPLDGTKFTSVNEMIKQIITYLKTGGGEISARNNSNIILNYSTICHGKSFVKKRYIDLLSGCIENEIILENNYIVTDYYEKEWNENNRIKTCREDLKFLCSKYFIFEIIKNRRVDIFYCLVKILMHFLFGKIELGFSSFKKIIFSGVMKKIPD